MLIIERHLPSILTFTDLPYHPTVRAVPHTAVSCFLISRCVASCFQLSL